MTTTAPASRRTFLAGTLAVTGAGVLTACGPGTAGTPASSPGSGRSPAAGQTPSPTAGEGAALVALSDVPVGGAVSATTSAGEPVVVGQPEAGTAVCFSAVCTHMGCTVEPEGAELVCPCHGSVFRAATGENVSGPAPRPLDVVPVEVRDGQVVEA
jgi:cytochrome b6-f complex iron-sulfur subunit